MNLKIKTGLVIILTLLIGIILGVVLERTMTRNRFNKRIAKMRNPAGFVGMIEHIIQPDESQREPVRKILDKYSKQFLETGSQFHDKMISMTDSLQIELEPILTKRQQMQLKFRLKRLREFGKDGPGPPPFGKPGRGWHGKERPPGEGRPWHGKEPPDHIPPPGEMEEEEIISRLK